jgi:hypothetical protein
VRKQYTSLAYCPWQLESILQCARDNDVERGGRYDVSEAIIGVWSHPWTNPACKAESTLLCRFWFSRVRSSWVRILIERGYDFAVALSELGILEQKSIGTLVHGTRARSRGG